VCCADIIIAMNPSTNRVFKDLLAKKEVGQGGRGTYTGPTYKGKGKADQEEVIAERVEPITTVIASPLRPPLAPTFEPRDKKKKEKKSSKHASNRSSTQRSPKCLKVAATEQEMISTFNFLNKKSMISDKVVIDLNDYEQKKYTSSSRHELMNALWELNTRALLISQVVGEEVEGWAGRGYFIFELSS